MLDLLRFFAGKVLSCSLKESSIWYFLPLLDGFSKVPFSVSSMRKTTAARMTATEIMMNADNVFSTPIDLNLPGQMLVHNPVQLVSSWWCWDELVYVIMCVQVGTKVNIATNLNYAWFLSIFVCLISPPAIRYYIFSGTSVNMIDKLITN